MFRKEGLVTILFPLCSLQSGRERFCFTVGNIHFFIKIFVTLFLWPHHMACDVEFPRQELNVCPLHRVRETWITGLQGKCPWRSVEPCANFALTLDIRFTSHFPVCFLKDKTEPEWSSGKCTGMFGPLPYVFTRSCGLVWTSELGCRHRVVRLICPPEKALPTRERPEREGYVILGSPGTRWD